MWVKGIIEQQWIPVSINHAICSKCCYMLVGNVSTYVNIFNWHPLRSATMKTGKQLASIYFWPHLEVLKTVTYETEDPFT